MIATFVKQWSIQPVAAAFWLIVAGLAAAQEAVPVQDPSAAESQASVEEIGNSTPAVSKARPAHLVVLRLSAAMLAAQINRECDRQSVVSDVVLGTPVTGVARLVGRLQVKPTPSTDRASFNATFSGTVHSRTVGRNGPVTIHGHSITRITASKEIFFEPGKGFHGGAPKISAHTQCFTDGITTSRGGLMGRITQRRAAEEVAAKQPTLTAIARDRASQRVAAAFEEHMAERLAQLNRAVEFQTRLAELRTGDGMRRLSARTTPEYLEIADAIYPNQTATALPALSKGSGNYPSIVDVGKKYDARSFLEFINAGRRMMPSFQHLDQEDKDAIAAFVLNLQNEQQKKYTPHLTAIDSFRMVPYQISGYNKFITKSGFPCLAPPWGVLNAIDLNTGDYVWKENFGEGLPPP
jgi:hypothetical protein